jgi:hypothetical protein
MPTSWPMKQPTDDESEAGSTGRWCGTRIDQVNVIAK